MNKNKSADIPNEMPFLQHIAELRMHIIRSIVGVLVGGALVGGCFPWVSQIIMAPLHSDFVTFHWFNTVGELVGLGQIFEGEFDIQKELKNFEVSGQFMATVSIVLVGGLIVSIPYVVWELFKFLKPGLTANERKYSYAAMFATILFFLLGVLFSYYMVIPLSVHFMFNFQPLEIENQWRLGSYMTMFVQTTLAMGIVFLMPVIVYFLTKIGIVTPQFLKTYRRYAFVVVLLIAAIITPADLMSMFIASIPLWLLYEFSILVSHRAYKPIES